MHTHNHSPEHTAEHHHEEHPAAAGTILSVRPHAGLSGDMMICGLIQLLGLNEDELNRRLADLFPMLCGTVKLTKKSVRGISGFHCCVELPHEHEHRTFADISKIISESRISEKGKVLALSCFDILAEAEACVHGIEKTKVHFHEVGALDSILDIGLACELFAELNPDEFICGALPLADGMIECAHGIISSPAPAVCALLDGIRVTGFAGSGETVTPTAVALLKTFNARFGAWPDMTILKTARVYGDKEFPNVPNGALFILGEQNA
jgi:uncharacterized protein (DUF111 family)